MRFVDCLDAVGVVEGKFGVRGHLCVDVDACVDQTDCIKVKLDRSDVAGRNKVILCLEVIGVDGAIMPSVRFRPDTESIIARPVLRKPSRYVSMSVQNKQR